MKKGESLLRDTGEGSITSDVFRPIHGDSGQCDEALGKMSDGHLILDSSMAVMGGLFRFGGAEAGEVLLHGDSPGVLACEASGIAWNGCACGSNFTEVFGASVAVGFRMIDWTADSLFL